MAKLYNLAKMTVASAPGTGAILLGVAVPGLLTFAQAGVQDGDVVPYAIADSGNCEIGFGTYNASGPSLSRDVVLRSSGSGNTEKIAASGAAQVFITPNADPLSEVFDNFAGIALLTARNSGSRINIAGGIVDPFLSTADINTGAASGCDFSNAGIIRPALGNARVTGGTPSMPFGGTAANINDNNPATTATTTSIPNLSGAGVASRIVAKIDFGSTKTLTKIELIGAKQSFGASSATQGLYYSADGTNWTQAGGAFATGTSASNFSATGTFSARYIAWAISDENWSSGLSVTLGDLNGYVAQTQNMSVASNAFTAASMPTFARGFVAAKANSGSFTVNTDVLMDISRDNGSTWTTLVLKTAFVMANGFTAFEADYASIAAQPSGTSMKWRLRTANNVDVSFGGLGMLGR